MKAAPEETVMKNIPFVILLILVTVTLASGGSDPFSTLGESRSIFSILENEGLISYIANVEISGTAVHDLLQNLKEGQGIPAFKSYYKNPASWRIHCNSIPSQKEHVTKVYNLLMPFYMAFSFTPQSQSEQIELLKKESVATLTHETLNGIKCWKIALVPAPGKSGIMVSTQPDGTRIVTLESIFWIDRENGVVVRNISRSVDIEDSEKQTITNLNTKWSEVEGRILPVSFEYILNDLPVHTQHFKYKVEGGYVLPSARELVLYSADMVPFIGKVILEFDDYRLNANIPEGIFK